MSVGDVLRAFGEILLGFFKEGFSRRVKVCGNVWVNVRGCSLVNTQTDTDRQLLTGYTISSQPGELHMHSSRVMQSL